MSEIESPLSREKRQKNILGGVLVHLVLLAAAAIALTPFFWMLCATIKRQEDLFEYAFLPWGHPERLTLKNFYNLFTKEPFGRWLLNSLFLSSTVTVLVVTLSSLGGFALAKYRFAGKRPLMLIMLTTMLLPGQVMLPGASKMMYELGWMNSYWAIVLPGAVSVFGAFLFSQAMQAVPDELLQAGRVDGCSELRLWWEVALPMVRPMVGAFTLPIGLANMVQLPEYRIEYGILMAGTLLSIIPVVVLFFVLQKDFIAGLAS